MIDDKLTDIAYFIDKCKRHAYHENTEALLTDLSRAKVMISSLIIQIETEQEERQ